MHKFLVALTFCGLMTGCTPTWFQDFKTDPVKQTDIILNSASSIERVAIVVFGQLKPLLPADKQAIFQSKFDGSVVALNKAMGAVRSAVKAAAEAQAQSPDLSTVIADVLAAVNDIKAVIDEVRGLLKTPTVAVAPEATAAPMLTQDPIGYDALGPMIESLKK